MPPPPAVPPALAGPSLAWLGRAGLYVSILCLFASSAAIVPRPVRAAAVPFGPEQVVTSTADSARVAVPADVDGDGDLDLVTSSLLDDTLAWYENTDGQGSFTLGQTITTTDGGGVSVSPADVDRDGDLDLIAPLNDSVVWYENTDGQGAFVFNQNVAPLVSAPSSVFAADIDGDGDQDVVVAGQNDDTVSWWKNDGLGVFSLGAVLTTTADGVQSVFAADVDRDGDLDVLSASAFDNTVVWFENANGLGNFFSGIAITNSATGATSVFAADIDGDGDLDVFSTAQTDDTINWHENFDGQGSFVLGQAITTTADGVRSVFAADIDGDGDTDVVSSSINDDTIAWYENTDGAGAFGSIQTISSAANAAYSAIAADLDGDGDLDVATASFNDDTIAWFENETIHRGVTFSNEGTITTTPSAPVSVFAADLDGDGDADVLSASSGDGTIAWYENTDGLGHFGLVQPITTTEEFSTAVFAADLDGDGDLDALSASQQDDTIAWYENTDGLGSFGPEQTISNAADGASAVFAADLDGDGDVDALSASLLDDTIAWYENTDGLGGFGTEQTISTAADDASAVFGADLDGDGDVDVLSASAGDDTIAWYENTDGLGSFGPQQPITTTALSAASVFAADVDGDGDLDAMVNAAANSWFENTDGLGSFGAAQAIPTSLPDIGSISAADIDGDGDLDAVLAYAFAATVAWHENTDGLGTFGTEQLIATNVQALAAFTADIDGDGDVDVLSPATFETPLRWYENRNGRGQFGVNKLFGFGNGARSVFAADVDGDGDVDALSASSNDDLIAWYENVDAIGSFGARQTITAAADNARSVFAADLDGDGDLDALSASSFDGTIAWFENTNGQGAFGAEQAITTTALGATSVFAADVDGDADLDVLSTSSPDSTVGWYENTDGLGSFGLLQTITTSAVGAESVFAADVNGDGNVDALSASSADDKIAWYENTDGLGSFGAQQTITTSADGARSVFAADVDGDGDADVLAASSQDDTVSWYENTDGLGSFGAEQTITTSAAQVTEIFGTDLDRDGDIDVLVASFSDDTIAWHENTDGLGSFGARQTIATSGDGPFSVFGADIDGDGDVDALSASFFDGFVRWHESRSSQAAIVSTAVTPTLQAAGTKVELLRIAVDHLGVSGDADAELDTIVLLFDELPRTPLTSIPARARTSAQMNALVDDWTVYRDDGSGVFESGSDFVVGSLSSLTLTNGIQTIDLTDADPNAQIAPGDSALFYVTAVFATGAGTADPNSFRLRHLGSHSDVLHSGTTIVLEQAPGSGLQPVVVMVPEPDGAWLLISGVAFLVAISRRPGRASAREVGS